MSLSKSYIRSFYFQMSLGLLIGAVVAACSPTKFSATGITDSNCTNPSQNCVIQGNYEYHTPPPFKVGAGKVDILFVDDNSASMSFEQKNMASKFAGFIENLDRKEIDYRIAITTTDLNMSNKSRLITFSNGKKYLTNSDSNRVSIFNNAIVRQETVNCESFMKGIINTYGSAWRSASEYQDNYSQNCASPDERGTQTSLLAISENADSFLRTDANLNIILVSDEDVRSGSLQLETNDKYETFLSMMNSKYPSKYWEFNSIIVKDQQCANIQSQQILDSQGQSAVGASIGYEYAKLSNSAAKDIDNNPKPRGQILDICQNDYAQHFNSIATQISDSSRLFTLECKPDAAPTVTVGNSPVSTSIYTWDGNRQITFKRGSEGQVFNIKYRCYKGVT